MDASAAMSSSPLPEVNPTTEEKKKKKKKKKPKTTESLNGRSVETNEPTQPSMPKSAETAEYQAYCKKQNEVLLQHRNICKRYKNRNEQLLTESERHIQQFITDNQLKTFNFNYDPQTGYSPESRIKLVAMTNLKTMLDAHLELFANLRSCFLPHKNPRSGSGRMTPDRHNQLSIVQNKLRHSHWVQNHNLMEIYYTLCEKRMTACKDSIENIPTSQFKVETYSHYETFISQTLELINVQHKLLEEKKELYKKYLESKKDTKKNSAEMTNLEEKLEQTDKKIKELTEAHNTKNQIMTRLLNQAVAFYCDTANQQDLIQLINNNREGFSIWLQQVNPEELSNFNLKQIINICIACDELEKVQRLLDYLLLMSREHRFDTKDALSLMNYCRRAFQELCKNKEFKENPAKVAQIKNILFTFDKIIKSVIECNDVSGQDQKSLNDILEMEYSLPLQIMLLEFESIMLTLNSTRLRLVLDEQKEAHEARQKAEKLAADRKKRVKGAQREGRLSHQEQAQPQAATMQVPAPSTEQSFPPAIKEALEAFTNKKSLDEISEILSPLINNPETSKIHKAQACFCYADLVRVVLTRQVHKNCENVCTVYNYGTSIRQARSDSSANQLPAREMLDKFAKAIEELSASQASFPLIESMTESFTRAVEAITTENDLEPEFLQALDQLHTGIQVLTSNMNKVAACCTNAQIIYDERGRLLKKQK
ncbi:hypothetical protein [Endozoicomonas sp. NE40]|uniref:RNAse (Barnase) inhibitor barstar/mevalonate kinase n=1 Tax=Endozoicomonas lisbonensis TaxID=3120522 RepID=A0ABV2SNZ8_9GAMM